MMFAHTTKVKLVGSFIAILPFLAIGTCLCKAQDQRSTLGELKLEGEHVERLVLQRKDGHTERFDRPGEIIKLPLGEYRLQQVDLIGGHTCRVLRLSERGWIKVAEDRPAELKVGAPLKHTVEVKRQGRVLVLDYKLLGIGGENYTGGERSKPPSFTVFKGEQIIDSDQFQYG